MGGHSRADEASGGIEKKGKGEGKLTLVKELAAEVLGDLVDGVHFVALLNAR